MAIIKIIAVLTLVASGYTLVADTAFAQLSLKPNCDPTLSPSDPGGCGIPAFIDFIRNIIQQLSVIAIPLAVIFIVWGGFVIMTAGGSEDRLRQGKKIITVALIGLAITLGAWLILTTISKVFFAPGFQLK